MSNDAFLALLESEISRVTKANVSKRHERVITGFIEGGKKALIANQAYTVFNSNDYLGLRHHPALHTAEVEASKLFGTGPGAVRFISGSLAPHLQLEQSLAQFHNRQAAMVFSSAFAANLGALSCLLAPQSKTSLITDSVAVISDELNHRSIIDGIRLSQLPKEKRLVYAHRNPEDLRTQLSLLKGNVDRVVVVTDGVFSMVGAFAPLSALRQVVDEYAYDFRHGVWLVVDDCHGVGIVGESGRGVEEIEGVQADVLIGTLGKALGSDGGYVVASKTFIDFLRESAATYIYSNSITPGTAAAGVAALDLLASSEGQAMLQHTKDLIKYLVDQFAETGFLRASDSSHPIQPLLIGDASKTAALVDHLFEDRLLTTAISYPVVAAGKDEIRLQLSALHEHEDIDGLMVSLKKHHKP